jgi:hypothetical protein
VEVSGRKTIDQDELKQLAVSIGFDIPYKIGKSHTRLYADAIYGPSYERGNDGE